MQSPVSRDAVVVSTESFESDDASKILWSNVRFLNALFEESLTTSEVSADALLSYYVDYYLQQLENGGFSQFVYNSRWDPKIVLNVREGLRMMNATEHFKLFEDESRLVEKFGAQRLRDYFASDYFGDNPDRDALDVLNDRFFHVCRHEDLQTLNAAWLRQLPNLVVLTKDEMRKVVRQRVVEMPDREHRIAEARAKEPRFKKVIRALCKRAGHELDTITAGDPAYVYEGVKATAWHFITDKGHHHMVDTGGTAIMFRGHSKTDRVCEIDTTEVLNRHA